MSPQFCTAAVKAGRKGKRKSFPAHHGARETAELKQESETETKMVLGAKNLRIALVREQWVHGEKNLVLRI